MKMLENIKKHGIIGSFEAIHNRLCWNLNNKLIIFFRILPINKNLIIFESEGDLSDNSYALFDYLNKNGYLNKYKVVWLVDDLESARKKKYLNTKYFYKVPKYIDLERAFYLATCHWYIYDHCNLLAPIKKRNGCFVINLWHGVGYKSRKGSSSDSDKSSFDMLVSLGTLSSEFLSYFCECSLDKIQVLGYPRIDYFFKTSRNNEELFKYMFKSNPKKVIFWMPTFRQSASKLLSENYKLGNTGLPILYDFECIKQFNSFLQKIDVVVVIKIHHLQASLPVFNKKYTNLIFLHDEDLAKFGLQLYEFIPYADALITDYSSIAVDYLVLDRPIIFTLDDYEKYNGSRGLWKGNTKDYMPGAHVYNYNDFCEAIEDIVNGYDKFADKRHNLTPKYHKYIDGNSSERILEYIGIQAD